VKSERRRLPAHSLANVLIKRPYCAGLIPIQASAVRSRLVRRARHQTPRRSALDLSSQSRCCSNISCRSIIEMKRRNPRFGCRRIAQQIAFIFHVEIDKDVVRRVLAKRCRPTSGSGGPSWLTMRDMPRTASGPRYEVTHVRADGAHSDAHGGALLPDILRWLWREDREAHMLVPVSGR
jgi:hypothetical protein